MNRHSWQEVTMAHWLKYPNPYARHVESADTLHRHIDPHTGHLHTTRLLLKQGTVPKWGRSFFQARQAVVWEESWVDMRDRILCVRTRNLNHSGILLVEETQTYRPHAQHPDRWTEVVTEVRVSSGFGWGLASRIEAFGLKKFIDNTFKVCP